MGRRDARWWCMRGAVAQSDCPPPLPLWPPPPIVSSSSQSIIASSCALAAAGSYASTGAPPSAWHT